MDMNYSKIPQHMTHLKVNHGESVIFGYKLHLYVTTYQVSRACNTLSHSETMARLKYVATKTIARK